MSGSPPKRESADQIARDASAWVVRIDAHPELTPDLNAWMAQDPRRAGAYYRALAAWRLADRARALPRTESPSRLSRRALIAGGGAMAAAATGVGVLVASRNRDVYTTSVGEVRWAPLSDGTRVAINTGSTLRVFSQTDMRRVVLEAGEAWFEVAEDALRPFIVEAGDGRVRATQAAFAVRHDQNKLEVSVTDGAVDVWRTNVPAPEILRVTAGQCVDLLRQQNIVESLPSAQIESRLAWREGMIALEGRSLAEAAQEFNRYNDIQVEIADPELGEQTLVGWFRATDVESFVTAASVALHARIVRSNEKITLFDGGDTGNERANHP